MAGGFPATGIEDGKQTGIGSLNRFPDSVQYIYNLVHLESFANIDAVTRLFFQSSSDGFQNTQNDSYSTCIQRLCQADFLS